MTRYADTVVRIAETQVGARYVYGAKESASDPNPKSHGGAFDCSGLVAWAVRRAGGDIPDGSSAQYQHCKQHGTMLGVDHAEHTRGALLFLGTGGSEHVVLCRGGGETIEARGAAYGVGEWSVYRDVWIAAAYLPGFVYTSPTPVPAPSRYQFVVHLQSAAGMKGSAVDGIWGPRTDQVILNFRGHYNSAHVAALQRVFASFVHVRVDGDWGTNTERAYRACHAHYYGR